MDCLFGRLENWLIDQDDDYDYDGSVCDGHEHYDDADHLTHFLWTCNWILKVHLEQQFFSLST